MPLLSVVIPVLNEEANIGPLVKRIREALQDISFELIWVDDGSTDSTRDLILGSADQRTLLIELEGNQGQSAAIKAGIDQSSGQYVVFLDGDGQNDPADIPAMLEKIEREGWGMVAGRRRNRHDRPGKKIPSAIANALIRLLTGTTIRDLGCTLKILRKDLAAQLPLEKGMHRFIPVLAKRAGGSMTQLDVRHHPRVAGRSKYGLERTFAVLRDLARLTIYRRWHPGKTYYRIRKIHGGTEHLTAAMHNTGRRLSSAP